MLIAKLIGVLMMGGSAALFWGLLPKGGVLSRWAILPVLASALPILIVAGFWVGLCLIILT